jgi:fumarylacetoacetate (FAA) hydrolase
MRLASLDDGTPDGRLVAVDGDACRRVAARTMLAWAAGGRATLGPQEAFDPAAARACLPRSWQFLDGSAYVNHVELVRRARGAEMPERFWHDPLMYQGLSVFDDPRAPIPWAEGWGVDLEGEVAVITAAVPMGATEAEAGAAIRALCLVNDVSLRGLIPDELAKGFGFVHGKPASALSPFAVAPDALPGWDGARLHGTLVAQVNSAPLGRVATGEDMTFGFPRLIAHAARTRALPAGTVIGSGTVSNRGPGGDPGRPVGQGGRGYACLAELRMVETLTLGAPATPFLAPGDVVRITYEDATGAAPFGAIEQRVEAVTRGRGAP